MDIDPYFARFSMTPEPETATADKLRVIAMVRMAPDEYTS